jgi:arylsulfatase A-like enzyme
MRMQKPNIIFIMADDMGYGDVGCYNPDTRIPTPHMDRLAVEGIRFTDAHSPSAVCTPTRYGVLTGRYCWRSRLKRSVLFGYEPPLIAPDRLTVPAMLRDVGYHTACIGKWHLGLGYSTKPGKHLDFNAPLPWDNATREDEESIDFTRPLTGGPNELGFDVFFGTSGCSTAQPPYGFIENDRFVEVPSIYRGKFWYTGRPGMTAPGWDDKEPDPTFSREAVQYIEPRAKSDIPFFLYLSTTSPHEPCLVDVVPEFARGKSEAGPRGDMVWLVDWVVGQVIGALDRTGLADNTLIMVTSDNGALPGDRKQGDSDEDTVDALYHTYGHKSCGDWRGYKAHIWEGGHREPLIARWPGMIKPDTVSDQLVGLTDLMATCAAIADCELPDDAAEDSVNILPALLGEQTDRPLRGDLIHHSGRGVFSLRQGRWKCIFDTQGSGGWPPPAGDGPVPGTPGQLYNIADDPSEQVNLWNERSDIVSQLRGLLGRYQEQGRSVPHRTSR